MFPISRNLLLQSTYFKAFTIKGLERDNTPAEVVFLH